MTADSALERAVAAFEQTMLKNSTRRTSVHSIGFWKQVGVKKRTPLAISRVQDGFAERGIILGTNGGAALGSERSKDWITLRFDDPYRPFGVPSTEWFEKITKRELWTEREVEFRFALPLLHELGYGDECITLGYGLTIHRGSKSRNVIADLAVFAEPNRRRGLIIVEAKSPGTRLGGNHFGQAASYAMWLPTPYYLVTNGEELHLFRNLGPGIKDHRLIEMKREELEPRWIELYRHLNPGRVLESKIQLEKTTEALASS